MSNGRFPKNEIISLLDVHRRHNLAESTSSDLILHELVDQSDLESLLELRLGYGTSKGNLTLRKLIADRVGVNPDDVLVTQGAALSLFLTNFELCGTGDEIIVATPCFPPTIDAMRATGATISPFKLSFEESYQIDEAAFISTLNPKVKLVSIASPQNPSGVSIPQATVKRLVEAVRARAPDAFLVVDETYRDATYDGNAMPSVAGVSDRIITTSSISKAYGAPGLRIGWLTTQSADLYERLTFAKLNTVISASVVDEALTEILFNKLDVILADRRSALSEALDRLSRWVSDHSHLAEWVRPDAGALCCVRLCHDAFSDNAVDAFYTVLEAHDLQVADGTWFGEEKRVFRLGFGYLPLNDFMVALEVLSATLSTTSDKQSGA
ncbi:MAG: aminotransferase class I/II-fold pyridoxal phosphate-dependent enzyme [Alphaproteobacteria bacterium]|nr:aminotransferase class I/II-fold pyridoxal phosphate-dependent enzyme [Alphaproteobacteria bacterium]